jgi:hypothetical protein
VGWHGIGVDSAGAVAVKSTAGAVDGEGDGLAGDEVTRIVATVGVDDPASVEVDKSVATVGVDDPIGGAIAGAVAAALAVAEWVAVA